MAFRKRSYPARRTGYRKRGTASRNAKVAASRKTNRPVRKALSRRVRPVTTNRKNNKAAILTLGKQVRTLQMQRYGEKQFQHQFIGNLDNTAGQGKIYPAINGPMAFMANDIYQASSIWQGSLGTSGLPTLQIMAKWTKLTTGTGASDEFQWNQDQRKDNVNTVAFMPISTTLKFRVQHQTDASVTQTHSVRFDVFRIRNVNPQGHVQCDLPKALGAYSNMLSEDPSNRNYFNTHQYHTKIASKTVTFYPVDHSRLYAHKDCTIKLNFKAKEFHPELDAPIPGDISEETMVTNIPTKDQIWVLVSTNTLAGKFEITAERWNVWRDREGVGS